MRTNRLVVVSSCVAFLCLAAIGVARAQTEGADEKQGAVPLDPTGTWQWDYEVNGNTFDFELKLDWDGKKLSGKYNALNDTTDIEEAKFEKDQLSFVTKREINGNEFVARFAGTAKPDDINGTVTINIEDEDREFPWHATRSVNVDDVVGTWQLSVETANGVVEPKLTITKDFSKLKGKSISEVFGELEAKNLELKDNVLSWEITGSNGGFTFNVKYKGKPRGNTIEGTNEFSVNGGDGGTMSFTGKRLPPEEKAKPAEEAKPAKEAAPATETKPAESSEN